MEYMHPMFVGKPAVKGNGKVMWVVYGVNLVFVMSTDRNSNDIVALCTSNILKLVWFLSHFAAYVGSVEYLPPHKEVYQPNYG